MCYTAETASCDSSSFCIARWWLNGLVLSLFTVTVQSFAEERRVDLVSSVEMNGSGKSACGDEERKVATRFSSRWDLGLWLLYKVVTGS